MNKTNNKQSGFGIILFVVLVAAIVIAYFVGQNIYTARKAAASVSDYTQCIKQRGAKVLLTYPQQCVFDGKTFVELKDQIQGQKQP